MTVRKATLIILSLPKLRNKFNRMRIFSYGIFMSDFMVNLHNFNYMFLCTPPNFVHISFKAARLRAKKLKISLLVEGGLSADGAYHVINL